MKDIENKINLSKKRKQNTEEQYRVIITKEVNEGLEALVKRTNEDYLGGEVTKSDIANSLLLGSIKSFSENDIKQLRNRFFDEKKMLRAILRDSSETSEIPEDIRKAIREHFGINEGRKKSSSKAQNDLSTSSNVDNGQVA